MKPLSGLVRRRFRALALGDPSRPASGGRAPIVVPVQRARRCECGARLFAICVLDLVLGAAIFTGLGMLCGMVMQANGIR